MHTGKISEIAYKRSVLKKISTNSENLHVCADGAHMSLEDVTVVMSSNCILKWFAGCEKYYLQKTLNDLYVSGGKPKYVQLQINIPADFEEKKLGRIVRCFDEAVQDTEAVIEQCNAYAGSVQEPVIHVTIIGQAEKTLSVRNIQEGMDVVMAGTAAVGASSLMAHLYEGKLRKKFHAAFVDDCLKISDFTDVKQIAEISKEHEPVYMHNVSDGGVFGAVWELASAADLGIETDIEKIPVWQETIEIAELFDYNPYVVDGTGAVLIVMEEGKKLVEELHRNGIYAEVIGKLTPGRDRVVFHGEEKRFLEPPRGDEIYHFL